MPSIDPRKEDERRYLPRWEVANRVVYRSDEDKNPHEARSRDVHFAGVSMYTEEYLPLNHKLKLTIFLSESDTIQVNGSVLWNKEIEQKQYLVGVNFHEISQKVQETLLKYAYEVKRDDLRKHWFEGWATT